MLGVLGIDGVLGMDGIDGGFIPPPPPMPDMPKPRTYRRHHAGARLPLLCGGGKRPSRLEHIACSPRSFLSQGWRSSRMLNVIYGLLDVIRPSRLGEDLKLRWDSFL